MLVDVIAGARPNFMKIAPIMRAMRARRTLAGRCATGWCIPASITTRECPATSFTQLGIPEPDVNLEVGSGTQAEQTAAIMIGYEKLLLERPQPTAAWWWAT